MFVGRAAQLERLASLLRQVGDGADAKPGKALLIRGRRRVGKSRLAEEFLERAGVPHLFFAASGRPLREELHLFTQEAAASTLPGAHAFRDVELTSWDAALRLLATALPEAGPAAVVLDEIPYIIEQDEHFEATLQRSFDRSLSRHRLLLIGIGSDLSMMEALNAYGRPFHQRAAEMVVPPLTPAEVGEMLGLGSADAFDARLVTGGLPLVCADWPRGASLHDYLAQALTDPTSALLVSAERSLAAEFPADLQARTVLRTVGAGERTFSAIARAAGIPQGSLDRSLRLLTDKRVVAADQPLSTKPSREKRYRVDDTYLRFWLAFLGHRIDEIERGRGARVLAGIERSWTSWRGRAVEPLIRDAVERLSPPVIDGDDGVPGVVGGYWTRSNDVEIDLVAADRAPVATTIHAVGSIKWLENSPFDHHDVAQLVAHTLRLPGGSPALPLLAVARSGCTADGVTALGPDDLLEAYRT